MTALAWERSIPVCFPLAMGIELRARFCALTAFSNLSPHLSSRFGAGEQELLCCVAPKSLSEVLFCSQKVTGFVPWSVWIPANIIPFVLDES